MKILKILKMLMCSAGIVTDTNYTDIVTSTSFEAPAISAMLPTMGGMFF